MRPGDLLASGTISGPVSNHLIEAFTHLSLISIPNPFQPVLIHITGMCQEPVIAHVIVLCANDRLSVLKITCKILVIVIFDSYWLVCEILCYTAVNTPLHVF